VTSLEQLSLAEFNNQGQRSMKMAIKMVSGFGSIETRRSKFGPIISIKVLKYVSNKSCSPIFIFFNEKIKKIVLIFDVGKWL
jgi:hypothetical protein